MKEDQPDFTGENGGIGFGRAFMSHVCFGRQISFFLKFALCLNGYMSGQQVPPQVTPHLSPTPSPDHGECNVRLAGKEHSMLVRFAAGSSFNSRPTL